MKKWKKKRKGRKNRRETDGRKVIPVTGRRGTQGCETSKFPHFLENRLTDGGEVVSTTHRASFIPQGSFLVLISVRD
jgi:hypothetical protein